MFEGLFQPMHLLIILIICIFLFGPKRLPELGKAIGDGIRGFREGMNPTPPPAAKTEETKPIENAQPK
jgi:sec-independent protein translocase protein TatA